MLLPPQLIASFSEGDDFYLVQEYIDGQDLSHEIVPGQFLRDSQVRDIFRQVLTILKFVHEQGVIHRDISPKNLIRRTEDRAIYLSDYHTGFAVVLSLQAPEDRRPTSRREFERSPAFRWLQDNAANYGFALSYPKGDPHYEPWRWRYVGPGSVFSTP